MMLKVILYAYMNNIYSCREIEKLIHRDIPLYLVSWIRETGFHYHQLFPQSCEE